MIFELKKIKDMKKPYYLLFILTITMVVNVGARGQSKHDTTGSIVVNAQEGMYDHGGTKLGYIDKDNIVRNNKRKKMIIDA